MLNLHGIVRGVIPSIHPDEAVTLYHSLGQTNVKGNTVKQYSEPMAVMAQIQSLSDDGLYHSGATGKNDIIRNCYLFSDLTSATKPSSIQRPLGRSGDIIQRKDSTWWLVVALKEDFSAAGWVNVSIQLQVNEPKEIIQP